MLLRNSEEKEGNGGGLHVATFQYRIARESRRPRRSIVKRKLFADCPVLVTLSHARTYASCRVKMFSTYAFHLLPLTFHIPRSSCENVEAYWRDFYPRRCLEKPEEIVFEIRKFSNFKFKYQNYKI